jgi:vanillate O-demethylase ferredoxin subunit
MTKDEIPVVRLRVSRTAELTSRVRLIEFASADGIPLPPFTAGAHIDLRLGNGETRSYSLVNDQEDSERYLIAVQLEADGGGGSLWIHDNLCEASEIEAFAPTNDFPLDESAPAIMIAGGIGVTPLISMARRLVSLGVDFDFHFCARSEAEAPFFDRLPRIVGDRLHLHYSEGAAPSRLHLPALLADPRPGAKIYVCGPKRLIEDARTASAHWPASSFLSELFTSHVLRLEDDRPDLSGAEAFPVVIASSGRQIEVPADKTILEVLVDAGITVQAVCKQGWCGTCHTGLLGGAADHRDEYLDDGEKAANAAIQLCVSRAMPGETLILDL